MKLTSFFIKNPVASIVLNSMLIIIGVMCFKSLTVREYPKVNTSVVTVNAIYPNASPELVETSVTNILEDELAGVEGVEMVRSWSKNGQSEIRLNFIPGVAIDKVMSYIRDAVSMARSKLPSDVDEPTIKRSGKSMGDIPFMAVSAESDNLGFAELTHFANITIKNALRSINGVASVTVMGQDYTFKVKLDPKKLHMFGVNVDEIYRAIQANNMSLPVGKFRDITPSTLESELKNVEDFEKIIVKHQNFSNPKNKQYAVFLRDVAEINLESNDKNFRCHINGKPGIMLSLSLSSDANPVEVSALVNKELDKLKKEMPEGITIRPIIDQAEFVRSSLNNIEHATLEAIFLVLGIVFLFLRNFRATVIPLVTIPISLIGSILFLSLCGFSINTMTLLAMVLAVGLVVDDAIVILENISRHIENGKSKLESALQGAGEIGKAIIAVTLTLVSVYAPFAFIQGAIGQLFIEFAVALAGSVLISGLVALTLSPLMCSKILKKNEKVVWPKVDIVLNNFTNAYNRFLDKMIHNKKLPISIAAVSLIATFGFFAILPNETAPKEDRGLVGVFIPPMPGKDINFYEGQVSKVEGIVGKIGEAKCNMSFTGDFGSTFVLPLIEKSKRSRSANDLVHYMYPKVMFFPSQDVWPWSWDSNLPGLADEMAFSDIEISISTIDDYKELYKNLEKVKAELSKNPEFVNPRHDLDINNLTYKIDVDNNIVSKLGLTNQQIARAIEVFFSGNSRLTFQKDGITYDITLDGTQHPWDLSEIYITNPAGKKISLSAVAKMRQVAEPKELFHFNQMKAAKLGVNLAKGADMSVVLDHIMEVLDDVLPKTYIKTPTAAAKSIKSSANTMTLLFAMALVFIFAILSLQFNNFRDPLIILITVPLACSGALFTIWIAGVSLNIYTQVGLITLVGLITKHGILIIEFTNQLIEKGVGLIEAVNQATTTRLRPILITTGAMVFGSLPLVMSRDSGFEARESIGYVLIGGLMFGTVFTLIVLPTLCCAFKKKG